MLASLAHDAVAYAIEHGQPLPVDLTRYPPALRQDGAAFVTLERNGSLLGCIGSLQAVRPLVVDIARNAHGAVHVDPRCPVLTPRDVPFIDITISILTPPEPMRFSSERDLISQLQPGVDGLLLEEGFHRGTFLPAVWESLPEPEAFLQHLKMKAGLPASYWSPTVRVSRYRTERIP
jgi:hypothetical protein